MKFAYLIEPPFNYVDADGNITGCDVALARHVVRELGIEGLDLIETEFAELLPGLGDGRWHMTTGMFSTGERRRKALFSRPIWALPDGLLVRKGNPHGLSGYASIAENGTVRLAVIRDQIQHHSAIALGVSEDKIAVFETYTDAAEAVCNGTVDAYASVGRAHGGFVERNPDRALDVILVPAVEKPPAFGSFAFSLNDGKLVRDVDAVLLDFLGTEAHRQMLASFGFSDMEVALVAA